MNTSIFVCAPKSKGSYFKMERTRLGIRQADVATLAGVPQSYVSLAERDQYIPWWALERLEKTLGFEGNNEATE